jgi:hypothetical protein
VRENRSRIDLAKIRVATLFPKPKKNANAEFKQDGLLMLNFSNSQSSKEFTPHGRYYRDYARAFNPY